MSTTEAQIRDTCEVGCCGNAQLSQLDIDNRFGVWIQSPVKMTAGLFIVFQNPVRMWHRAKIVLLLASFNL